jgi:quercetin dioxygenase-like cupin family protein
VKPNLETNVKYLLPLLAIVLTACASYPQPPVYTINGEVPIGKTMALVNTHVMIDMIQADGNRLLVTRGTRQAGTRVGIHYHKYGGHTCVETGTITDFVEGKPNGVYPAGTCYYMPPATPMAAANLGDEPAILQDTFILPPGEPTITIIEPGAPGYNTTILSGIED